MLNKALNGGNIYFIFQITIKKNIFLYLYVYSVQTYNTVYEYNILVKTQLK